jgi:hypothetical protein
MDGVVKSMNLVRAIVSAMMRIAMGLILIIKMKGIWTNLRVKKRMMKKNRERKGKMKKKEDLLLLNMVM